MTKGALGKLHTIVLSVVSLEQRKEAFNKIKIGILTSTVSLCKMEIYKRDCGIAKTREMLKPNCTFAVSSFRRVSPTQTFQTRDCADFLPAPLITPAGLTLREGALIYRSTFRDEVRTSSFPRIAASNPRCCHIIGLLDTVRGLRHGQPTRRRSRRTRVVLAMPCTRFVPLSGQMTVVMRVRRNHRINITGRKQL